MDEGVRFNSRTPCGVRLKWRKWRGAIKAFQFTHPVWGATKDSQGRTDCEMFQFTHPVWGATDQCHNNPYSTNVSIHAPRVGCDRERLLRVGGKYVFQFTHPVWGATDREA